MSVFSLFVPESTPYFRDKSLEFGAVTGYLF